MSYDKCMLSGDNNNYTDYRDSELFSDYCAEYYFANMEYTK